MLFVYTKMVYSIMIYQVNVLTQVLHIFSTSFLFQTLLLRVVVSSKNARRIQLFEVPESVNILIEILRERLELESDFSLQFEDPEFGNALCNLTSMSELPAERAVLHIVWDSDSSLNQSSI